MLVKKVIGVDDDVFYVFINEDDAEGGGDEGRTNRSILTRVSSLAGKSWEAKIQLLVDGVNDFPCLQTTVVTARTSIENEEAIVVPVTTTGGEGGAVKTLLVE